VLRSESATILARGRIKEFERSTRRPKPERVNRYNIRLKHNQRKRVKIHRSKRGKTGSLPSGVTLHHSYGGPRSQRATVFGSARHIVNTVFAPANAGLAITGRAPTIAVQALVSISDHFIGDLLALGATYRLRTDGTAQRFTEFSGTYQNYPGEWMLSGVHTDYQLRATLVSGDTPTVVGPALGVWGSFGGQYTIGASMNTVLFIEIRQASTLTVLDSATIELDTF
jgi:hypothetical protein